MAGAEPSAGLVKIVVTSRASPPGKAAVRVLVKEMKAPCGDHEGAAASTTSGRLLRPSASITQMSPSNPRVYAILVPPGDQAGAYSSTLDCVSRRRSVPSARIE